MTRQVLQILFVFSVILLLAGCAQIVPLSGGNRDVAPPKLTEAIPARNSLNFKADFITLKFDEFVQVKDLSNQLIVTPRLKTLPDIEAEGKKILIRFKKGELLPNTTYRIFFGKAIADMHESNSIPGFEYVFSTGSHIDTVEVKGSVRDAFNNKPAQDILIGMYFKEKDNDSLVYKTEPDYITRSDENGSFNLKNLPYKTFVVYGISDKNKNYLYDGEIEKAACLSTDLKLISDTNVHLSLFQEEVSKSFIKNTLSPYFGFTQIFLNKKTKVRLSTLKPNDQPNIYETHAGVEKDTVSLFYKNINDTLGLVLHNLKTNKKDTLRISLPKNNQTKKRFKSYTINTSGGKLLLYNKLRLTFLNWMDTSKIDLSKLKLASKEDSSITKVPVKGHWIDVTSFEVDQKLKEGVQYKLQIDTNAFFDHKQFKNDSITFNFITQSKTEFGKLTLKLLFNKKQNYVVQLINEQDKLIKEQFVELSLSSSNAVTLDFIDVPPGICFAKIVFDDNKNKKWDTGSILSKQQPEKVIINSKQLKILSDWEVEEEIQIKE